MIFVLELMISRTPQHLLQQRLLFFGSGFLPPQTCLHRDLPQARADPNVGYFGSLFLAVQENCEASVTALLSAKARPGAAGAGGLE